MLLLLAMTIAHFLAAAAENLSLAPADMSVTAHQNHLVRAANASLAAFLEKRPDLRRSESRTVRLAAALSKTATVAVGDTAITFDPAWAALAQADYLGRSVVIGGLTDRYNQLSAASTLLLPWEGSAGSQTLSIRSDAVTLGSLEDSVEGDVVLSLQDRQKVLTFGRPPLEDSADVMRFFEAIPEHWWIEPLSGVSGGDAPLYVLRVFPQPDQVCSLTFKRRLWPAVITTAMLESTTVIPVLAHEEQHLINLAQEVLFTHPLWLGSADKEEVAKAVQRSRDWLDGQTSNRGSSQPAKCGTKKGF